jgi:predicted nucleic acid-binding protein
MSTPVVFDCMVLLQAATSAQGPASACVRLVEHGEVPLVLSRPVLAEVREVLYRSKVRRKFPHLTDERAEEFLRVQGVRSGKRFFAGSGPLILQVETVAE